MSNSIIVGSAWGDEGKGHMTDILCNQNTLNVRFNGGAQASHTVVTPDGKRHAFKHFGSGTFKGAKTFLSEFFIVNPFSFCLEQNELHSKFNITPYVYVHPNAIVTTLWDMYINQAIETIRGDNRHGSCGMGINETVERNTKYPQYRLTVLDLLFPDKLHKILIAIQDEYVPIRLKKAYNLELKDLPIKYQNLLTDSKNVDMSMFFASEFIAKTFVIGNNVLSLFENNVFEGAQGLLLDQNNKENYPNITTSNTGVKNAMQLLSTSPASQPINIYYMSRCYLTRHGAGSFKGELDSKPYKRIIDETNIPNEFQGSLRFGYLNFDLLIRAIQHDFKHITRPANINIAFTCLDQLDEYFTYIYNGQTQTASSNDFLGIAWKIFEEQNFNLYKLHATNGLTGEHFITYNH